MNVLSRAKSLSVILLAASLFLAGNVAAQYDESETAPGGPRWDVWLALSSWPGLNDLQPVAGGSFKSTGYGLGTSVHWPVKQLDNSNLLLGFEAAISATDSDVPVVLDDLLARHMYLGVSGKYSIGKSRGFSLDAGLGYYLVDIAQLESDYAVGVEFKSWEESAAGAFVGATWDLGAGQPDRDAGLSLAFKVHYADFGTVRDEDTYFTPVLGPDAGVLDGPSYVFQIGYSLR